MLPIFVTYRYWYLLVYHMDIVIYKCNIAIDGFVVLWSAPPPPEGCAVAITSVSFT